METYKAKLHNDNAINIVVMWLFLIKDSIFCFKGVTRIRSCNESRVADMIALSVSTCYSGVTTSVIYWILWLILCFDSYYLNLFSFYYDIFSWLYSHEQVLCHSHFIHLQIFLFFWFIIVIFYYIFEDMQNKVV